MPEVDQIISTAKFGDLIEFSYPIGYSHWGVYADDGYVVHFAVAEGWSVINLLLGETMIRRVPLAEVNVPKGVHASISNNCHSFEPSAPEDMRLRCSALLGQVFQYHLLSFNCEHFATYVRYGKAICNQVLI
uniref:LRAT domain-containing protein n=1 Tax=Anabas testudineus TaxID=64144 RepID=A0A3Q1JXC0_ANATE